MKIITNGSTIECNRLNERGWGVMRHVMAAGIDLFKCNAHQASLAVDAAYFARQFAEKSGREFLVDAHRLREIIDRAGRDNQFAESIRLLISTSRADRTEIGAGFAQWLEKGQSTWPSLENDELREANKLFFEVYDEINDTIEAKKTLRLMIYLSSEMPVEVTPAWRAYKGIVIMSRAIDALVAEGIITRDQVLLVTER